MKKNTTTAKTIDHNFYKIGITYSAVREAEPTFLRSSWDVRRHLKTCFDESLINYREEFVAIFFNPRNEMVGYSQISTGGTTGVVVDIKHIMQRAILSNCTSFIVAHNHPSGKIRPSEHDKVLTRKIQAAGQVLDINLIDHVIIANDENGLNYYSFADEGEI